MFRDRSTPVPKYLFHAAPSSLVYTVTASHKSKQHALFVKIVVAAAACSGIALIAAYLLLPILGSRIEAGQDVGYIGDLVGWLSVKDPTFADTSVLLEHMRLMLVRGTVLLMACAAAAAALIAYFPDRIKAFFEERDHAANLAVFRIAVFSVIFFWSFAEQFAFFGSLPASLRFPPPGLGWISGLVPVSPELADGALWLLRISALAAAVGLFTRISAFATLILALYVFGIPQLYGKIGHYHHLVWFGAILWASPCADALSMDAWRRRYREKAAGSYRMPGRHRAYGLPLRICWLLFGVIYFFPGVWKYVLSGSAWAFSDNLKYKMYSSWANFGDFEPFIRVDAFPTLLQIGAALVILFEIAFVFCLFFPRIRRFVIAFGFVFHLTAGLFLVVPFWQLHVLYVVFVDWEALYSRIKERLRPATAASVHHPARNPVLAAPREHAVALRSISAVLLAGGVICGTLYIDSWPFGVYPSHATMSTATATSMLLSISNGDSTDAQEINLFANNHTFESTFGSVRFRVLTERILSVDDPSRRDRMMRTLLDVVARKYRPFAEAESVRFYRIRVDVRPERAGTELERELIAQIEARPAGNARTKSADWFR